MRKPNKYNTHVGYKKPQRGGRIRFTFDEIENNSSISFEMTNPTDDFSHIIVVESDIVFRNNDRIISDAINGGNALTIESVSKKPVRNQRRGKTVYEYRIGLK